MRAPHRWLSLLVLVLLSHPSLADDGRGFPVYDNMFFTGEPGTAAQGLLSLNIIYGGEIWPAGTAYGSLPERARFAALVARHSRKPGPIVLDIEKLPLEGDRETIARRLHVLESLADWAHAAAPGRVVGYFGYNTLTDVKPANWRYAQALARHVDALFPHMYTHADDRTAWARRAAREVREARSLAEGKPVYLYLWPQYDAHTPKQFQWIAGDYWRFQLETARRCSDGVVLWGTRFYDWNVASGWWDATIAFIQGLPKEEVARDGLTEATR
jgi:hypothetical protein